MHRLIYSCILGMDGREAFVEGALYHSPERSGWHCTRSLHCSAHEWYHPTKADLLEKRAPPNRHHHCQNAVGSVLKTSPYSLNKWTHMGGQDSRLMEVMLFWLGNLWHKRWMNCCQDYSYVVRSRINSNAPQDFQRSWGRGLPPACIFSFSPTYF